MGLLTGPVSQQALSLETTDTVASALGKRGSGFESCSIVVQAPLMRVMHSTAPLPTLPRLMFRLVTLRFMTSAGELAP